MKQGQVPESRGSESLATVAYIQERDPGSGTAHHLAWSSDSKCVYIYGAGRLAGLRQSDDIRLIYRIEDGLIYDVDLSPYEKAK